MSAYKMQMGSPDSFVLNRYGRALFNLAMKQNCNENLKILKKAERLLSTSISWYTMNWFAYSTRMQVMDELGSCDLICWNV
jgi:F0F1-type ATP synthase delta subunit